MKNKKSLQEEIRIFCIQMDWFFVIQNIIFFSVVLIFTTLNYFKNNRKYYILLTFFFVRIVLVRKLLEALLISKLIQKNYVNVIHNNVCIP